MTFSEAFTAIREDGAKAMRLPKWNNDVRVMQYSSLFICREQIWESALDT